MNRVLVAGLETACHLPRSMLFFSTQHVRPCTAQCAQSTSLSRIYIVVCLKWSSKVVEAEPGAEYGLGIELHCQEIV